MEEMIDSFTGDYFFLSNFYPISLLYEGRIYKSVEHAYQASKTLNDDERKIFTKDISAKQAKGFGRKAQLREDWEKIKLNIMEDLVRIKFTSFLRTELVSTASQDLIEGNYWGDSFWGVYRGFGENHLGKILMKIREDFLHENNKTR